MAACSLFLVSYLFMVMALGYCMTNGLLSSRCRGSVGKLVDPNHGVPYWQAAWCSGSASRPSSSRPLDWGVVLLAEPPLGSGAGLQLGEPVGVTKFREEISDEGAPNGISRIRPALGALVAWRPRPAMMKHQNDEQR